MVKATGGEALNILLVDSNVADASRMRQWLETGAQASLDHAPDTAVATRMMAEREWDLVVIDPAVPEGFEFLKRAKSLDRWLAALIVTARQDPEFLQLAVQARIDGLMFKPVTDAQFTKQALLLAGESRTRRKRQQKRVLAIGAHPDDVEIGCGGALAKHRSKGDLLHILTLSRGAAGGDVNIRVGEAEQAAEFLGAKLEFGNVQDGHITEGIETIELIRSGHPRAAADPRLHAFPRGHASGSSRRAYGEPGRGARRAQRLLLSGPVLDRGIQPQPVRRHHGLHQGKARRHRRLQEPGRAQCHASGRRHPGDGALLGPRMPGTCWPSR